MVYQNTRFYSAKHFALVLTTCLACIYAHAVPVTYSTSGTITSGTDYLGNFSNGIMNRNLSGLSFTQSVTFDPTLVTPEVAAPPDYTEVFGHLYSGIAIATITIGSVSHSYTYDASKFLLTQVALINWLTQGDTSRFDGAVFKTYGLTENYTSVEIGSNVFSRTNPLQLGLNLDQNWSYSVHPDDMTQDAWVAIYGPIGENELQYAGTPLTISMQVATSVPEPSEGLLLSSGLAALLVMRRKTRA